jgi:hypothetical protein
MKNRAIQYLAPDVHQATVVASLRDESGKILMRATVPTEIKAILTLVQSAGPRVHVAFEEGTQAQWLHDGLIDHAERVIVCNVRGRSETTNKSDRIDADGDSAHAVSLSHQEESVALRRLGRSDAIERGSGVQGRQGCSEAGRLRSRAD